MPSLSKLIVRSARAGLALQRTDGSFPPGHNGPYRDPETPLRNTGHWLISMAYAARTSGEEKFLDSVQQAADYVLSPEHRPHNATWLHRDKTGKDHCNGLIGPAWTIEALCAASDALQDDRYAAHASEVLSLIPYDESVGMWHTLEIDGSDLGFDPTLNHQVWLAMAAALLVSRGNSTAKSQASGFLDKLDTNLTVDDDGLIQHGIGWLATGRSIRTPRQLASFFYRLPKRRSRTRLTRDKAIGYHAFNTYAFAVLKGLMLGHKAWESVELKRAIRFVNSESYLSEIGQSLYGYPYNPPGFEVAMTLERFGADVDSARRSPSDWVLSQIDCCLDETTQLMDQGAIDSNTQAARIYEATRLGRLPLP
jgi:hypothetical protein